MTGRDGRAEHDVQPRMGLRCSALAIRKGSRCKPTRPASRDSTLEEAAEYAAAVSQKCLRRWISDGQLSRLPAPEPKLIRISQDDLDGFLSARPGRHSRVTR